MSDLSDLKKHFIPVTKGQAGDKLRTHQKKRLNQLILTHKKLNKELREIDDRLAMSEGWSNSAIALTGRKESILRNVVRVETAIRSIRRDLG